MHLLLLASLLCLPIAPINPVEEDTVSSINFHVAAGVTTPNGVVGAGPELSARYELRMTHPLVVRCAVDFKYSETNSHLFPKGELLTSTVAVDLLYYRGTRHMTGYVGIGGLFAHNNFSAFKKTSDSLMFYEDVESVDVTDELGVRITLGLRFHEWYSFEIAVTEVRPRFVKNRSSIDGDHYSRDYLDTRMGGFRVSVGYLLPILRR